MTNSELGQSERELIFELAHQLTGTMEVHSTRHEIVITNVVRRMHQVGKTDLNSYLSYVSQSEVELAHFISAVTIHTTSWFREMPHYRRIERTLAIQPSKVQKRTIRILSAACSTGEELYSFGMVLEMIRRQYPSFEYELVGFDVDPICVQRADAGFYHISDLHVIPQIYRHFLIGRKGSQGQYLVDPEIRQRTYFHVGNLLDPETFVHDPFDLVVCRNVLIYFSEARVNEIISNLIGLIKPEGSLTLGHSESIDARPFHLLSVGESTYRRSDEQVIMPMRERPITILSIDDSSWTRLWLATTLAEHGIKVITADSTESATELMIRHRADLITIDINVQERNAITWLTKLRREGSRIPVILLTETNVEQAPEVIEALSSGSHDFVNKTHISQNTQEFVDRINGLVKAFRSRAEAEQQPATVAEFKNRSSTALFNPDLILVGASTGGTDAICSLLSNMPANCPPVVCVQHIPREFAPAFLERLAKVSGLTPASPEKGKELQPGHIYLSTTDAHIGVRMTGDKINVYSSRAEKVSGHRPSVDYLFQTASYLRNRKIIACLLTGMGRDGAEGLLELKRHGALTLAQDERSSVVWGMPGEAVRLGAAMVVGNIEELRFLLLQNIRHNKSTIRTGS